MKITLFFIHCFVLRVMCAQTAIDSYILSQMETKHISGVSASVIKSGKLVWVGNYGLANRGLNDAVDEHTAFMLASISKTFTCTAMMQLYEEGLFGLDDDINGYLPFEVHNPDHYDSVITFRHLMSHTSSLQDNWDILSNIYVYGDSPISLAEFMEGYFVPGGEYYDEEKNFYNYAPSEQYNYCNEGIALCGYIVELLSGQPFNEYCNTNIFEPLCMENTAWFLSELDSTTVAHPYTYSGGEYHDAGLYGYPDYPDGQLRTTAISLAKFLWMNMNNGNFDGVQLLDTSTIALIRSSVMPGVDPTQGLIWYRYTDDTGTWWGHSGGDTGVSTDMFFNESTQTGVIVLTNSGANHNNIWYEIVDMADSLDITDAPDIACITELPSGIHPITETLLVSLYPNPSSDLITITTGPAVELHVTIYDVQGVAYMHTTFVGDHQLNISLLPAGLYTVVATAGDGAASMIPFVKL